MRTSGSSRPPLSRGIPIWKYWYHLLWAALGILIYGRPDKKLFIIGVTGTKGKSTTLELLNAVLEAGSKKTALFSSIRVKIGDSNEKNMTGNTMPGRLVLRKFFQDAVAAQCTYALVEVTSQGVVASRHRFISWNTGIITNISPEHTEDHGSFKRYRDAKRSFLQYVLRVGGSVFINRDDANSAFFLETLRGARIQTYSAHDRGMQDVFRKIHPDRQLADKPYEHDFLLSDFNRANAAAAVELAREIGIPEQFIESALRAFAGVPGRMEFAARHPFSVVVDYAHTPDSLRAVYGFLRKKIADVHPGMVSPRLICVLGAAGGGRDTWKRPEMGKIAAEHCDEIILTDEDPYNEEPGQILSEIQSGIPASFPSSHLKKILDRRAAITEAIAMASEGDFVILTGKGSEDFIHLARGKKIPWNERKTVEEILATRRAAN